MLTYIWLIIIVAIAIGVVVVIRQKQLPASSRRQELPPLERTIFTLQIGDIVEHMGVDWVVEGKLMYDDNGYNWIEYLLQEGDRICWLAVEEDDLVQVSLLDPTDELEITGDPPAELSFTGESYRRIESGEAFMNRVGTTLNRTSQKCRYFDYQGPGDKVLSVEDWDGNLEVTVGRLIRPSSLTLLPGDGRRVY